MTNLTREKIFAKLENYREYISYLKKAKQEATSQKKFTSDFHLFGSVERYLQLCTQIIIDVGHLIIIDSGDKRPEDNYEMVSTLRQKKIISKKTADNVTSMIGLRNLLVHEYGHIDRNKVYKILKENITDLDKFYKEVVAYLKK
mgnify:CR=1 FL=1